MRWLELLPSSVGFGVLLAFAVLAAGAAQAPTAAGQSAVLDGPGVWTLRDLGYSDIVMPAGGGTVIPSPSGIPLRTTEPVTYLLPDGAAQGPDIWYLMHFHFEIEFQEDTQGGSAEVATMINFDGSPSFGTSAAIEFMPVVRNGALTVDWDALGLTDGRQTGSSESGRVEMQFSNYLSNAGVRPGENSILFVLREYEGVKVAALHVFDDTSIEVSPLSPPELAVDVAAGWEPPARGGETFEVPYTVRNVGGWPAKDVVAEVSYPEDGLWLLGAPTVTTLLLEGGEETSGNFKFRALSRGAYDITLSVGGRTGGNDQTTVTATITSPADDPARRWGLVALVVGLSALPIIPFGRLLDSFTGRGVRPD